MKADKNTIIGMVLLAILFFGYFWYNNKSQQAYLTEKKRVEDSIARVNASKVKPIDTVAYKADSLRRDSADKLGMAGIFTTGGLGKEQLVTLENKVIKITLSSKGGTVKSVELKNYTAPDGNKVILGGNENDRLGYNINTGNKAAAVNDLFFTAAQPVTNPDGSQSVNFSLQAASGESIVHQYILKPDSYSVDWNVVMERADKLLNNGGLNLQWQWQTTQLEKSVDYERSMSNICFSEDNSFDYISRNTEHKFEKPAQWVSVVQQFFNTTVIARDGFSGGDIHWKRSTDSSKTLSDGEAILQAKVTSAHAILPFQLYYGPNDYKILKAQADGMDKIVNLGRDMYSFVRPINRFIIMPVFDFFGSFVSNFGWVILLLTVFIRLVTSPLTYSSYLSGSKMKVLRPELDVLKKKFGDDQQGFAMEQMKLFKEAGVNPLGGCIPALLQIPIFFALYSFFNSNIALRGQAFLWSKDLSVYDAIARLPFSGDTFNHISLFTITAVITSFAISLYNMGNTPTQDNPAMKYMPYIFPFMMLFFFNRLPSALTWYYTVSNTITLLLQFVIQRYIIDHDKILAKMQEARSKPKVKSKSKWQERYEQMMEAQKKVQDTKNKK